MLMLSRPRAGGPGRVAYLDRADLGYILLRNRNEYQNLTVNVRGFITVLKQLGRAGASICYLHLDGDSGLIRWPGMKREPPCTG